ncbi:MULTISPECIES: hypothetical protein [Nostocales]|uniref:Uncharacterized protein n=2 Tax=Nostocales TaxID=1161 RepID=A0A8S9T578_9CYAN|nr:hypothetical protein [Tolypothrix bouteillei]KAF3886689.1 hypothetical protein DA73_0400015290 [Tolypothrix bouteillei VB521301]
MVIKLELKPEVEARLIAKATAQGVSIETYLESLIEERLTEREGKILAGNDWHSILNELGKSSSLTKAQPLSDDAISRESIYREREDSQL